MNNKYGKQGLMLLVSVLLSACGDSSSSGSSFSSASIQTQTPTYSGKTTPALLTSTNAVSFAGLVVGSKNIVRTVMSRDASGQEVITAAPEVGVVPEAGWVSIGQSMAAMVELSTREWRTQARALDTTDACSGGGSMRQTGNIDDITLAGTVTMNYTNCVMGDGALYNGSAQALLAISPVDDGLLSYTLTMGSLSMRLDGVSYALSGTEQMNREVATGKMTSVSNILLKNTVSGAQSMSENATTVLENGTHSLMGKLCLNTEGCVTISTLRPFVAQDSGILEQGELQLTGAAGSRVVLSAADVVDVSQPRRVVIGLDADGDGTFETVNLMDSAGALSSLPPGAAPVAKVVAPASGQVGGTVHLDGSSSTGQFPFYLWTLEVVPAGSTATLSSPRAAMTDFIPDKSGEYQISLKVSNTDGTSNLATTRLTVTGVARALGFKVVDAEYSDALERIVTVSRVPDKALRIINPVTGAFQTVALQLPPTSLALSPDGKTAVVGHDGAVTHVNLQTASVLRFVDGIGFSVFDITLAENGMAYASAPVSIQWGKTIWRVDLNTGIASLPDVNTSNLSLYGGAHLQYEPGMKVVYAIDTGLSPTDLHRLNVAVTPFLYSYDSSYHGDYNMGGFSNNGLWLTEDSKLILTPGGTVFQTSNQQATDLIYLRSLSDAGAQNDYSISLVQADHSQEVSHYVVIGRKGYFTDTHYTLKTYSTPLLNLGLNLSLDGMSFDGSTTQVIPQFVFFSGTGAARYGLLEQGDTAWLMDF